jgi:hypothetical protein
MITLIAIRNRDNKYYSLFPAERVTKRHKASGLTMRTVIKGTMIIGPLFPSASVV